MSLLTENGVFSIRLRFTIFFHTLTMFHVKRYSNRRRGSSRRSRRSNSFRVPRGGIRL